MKKAFKRCARIIIVFVAALSFCIVSSGAADSPQVFPTQIAELESSNPDEFLDCRNFYYNQLTETEKEIYKTLIDSKECIINNAEIFCMTGTYSNKDECFEQIKRAVYAYCYDNPESSIYLNRFMIKGTWSYEIGCYEFYLAPSDVIGAYTTLTAEEIKQSLNKVELVTKDFVKTLTGTDLEKLCQIHDWLIDDAVYDSTHSLPHTSDIYGAIVNKECVCAGYANAFKYIANMANLNVIYVTGNTIFPDYTAYHAWNIVYINNKWRLVDTTWDISYKEYNAYQFFLILPEHEKEYGITRISETKRFVYPN